MAVFYLRGHPRERGESFCEKITCANIADALRINRSYLCAQLKRETGENLSDFVNRAKIDEAKHMLLTTTEPIASIADMLAFSSQSYFQTIEYSLRRSGLDRNGLAKHKLL